MNRTKWVACALLAVGLIAVGCAKPPQVELDALKAKMGEVQAEASKWAPEAWQKAQDAMNAVNAEVDAQNAKFALLRSYSKAKELITTATTEATAAATSAAEGKSRWQADAQAAVDAAKAAVTASETAMADLDKCRRKPKGFSKDMEMMKGNLDGLKAQIAGLDSAMAAEDFQAAKSSADSLKASLDSMAMEMANAKTKIKC